MPRGTKAWPTRGPASRPALHVTTGEPLPRPRCERPLGWRRPHRQGPCAPPTGLRRLLRWLAQGSRAPSPEGSLPGFPWGDVARRLNPCPPCYRAAFASSLILCPQPRRHASRLAFPRGGRLRVYHVPYQYRSGLGRASGPVARHLRQGTVEAPAPGHVPFGPSLSASYASVLACRTSRPLPALHITLTIPLAPGSRPPGDAGSRRFGSRLCGRRLREGATLSRRLRTPLAPASAGHQRRTLR